MCVSALLFPYAGYERLRCKKFDIYKSRLRTHFYSDMLRVLDLICMDKQKNAP